MKDIIITLQLKDWKNVLDTTSKQSLEEDLQQLLDENATEAVTAKVISMSVEAKHP